MTKVPTIDWKKIFHRRIKPTRDFSSEPGTHIKFAKGTKWQPWAPTYVNKKGK